MKQKIIFWLGWAISIFLLTLTVRNVDWSRVIAAFTSVSPIAPLLMIGVYLLSFLLRSVRWKILLPTGVSLDNSLYAVVLGYAANNILPSRLGELVRAQAIGKKCQISRSLALASIFVERIFDGLIITIFLYISIIGSSLPNWAYSTGRLGMFIFGGTFTVIAILALTRPFWNSKLSKIPSSKWRDALLKFGEGLTLVWRTPFLPLSIFVLSLGIWLIETGVFYLGIQAFNLKLPPAAALFMMALVNLGVLIPSSPGYLGAFQYFGVLALSAWQVPQAESLACSVLIHACQYIPITLWGVSLIPYFGFSSLSKLKHEAKQTT
ncbi:lysylphosphatidylglycerol synthase transmembrane domain-containing protein [Chlorogloeopsis sp. ULAP02]|uniref:lysylphosphatidylglycerol synthase transmembrane domain-containing protein n=1 Tax=Chlorogloeopsis sp. ULAP02 TaxID=3107926 RepID=UPI0031349CC3